MQTGQHKAANWNWTVIDPVTPTQARSTEHAMLAVLMDIREELRVQTECLRQLRDRANCHETLTIPRMLRRISANTHKPRRRKRAQHTV